MNSPTPWDIFLSWRPYLSGPDLLKILQTGAQDPQALDSRSFAPLDTAQIQKLEKASCLLANKESILAGPGFRPEDFHNCVLEGPLLLQGPQDFPGIRNSSLKGVYLGPHCSISQSQIKDTILLGHNHLENSQLSAAPGNFSQGRKIALANENGRRHFVMDRNWAWQEFLQLLDQGQGAQAVLHRGLLDRPGSPQGENQGDEPEFHRNLLMEGVSIRHCPWIESVILEDSSQLRGVLELRHTWVGSSKGAPSRLGPGALVRHSQIQEGCTVDASAQVENSFLFAYCHITKKALLDQTIMGPGNHCAEAEITSSLVGPLTGMHHHGLLIAAWWPQGRGNLGYGANVGSNHTGRLPDQEIHIGEGSFFGLGCCIKYPSHLLEAPYTLFATGVSALPQKMTFPFSLVSSPMVSLPGFSPGLNQLFPGWGISENLYGILRNEQKYSLRAGQLAGNQDLRILRPEILEMVARALSQLQSLDPTDQEDRVWTSRDLPGIGKNYVLEADRKRALDAYRWFLAFGIQRLLLQERFAQQESRRPSPDSFSGKVCPGSPGPLGSHPQDQLWLRNLQGQPLMEDLQLSGLWDLDTSSLLAHFLETFSTARETCSRNRFKDFQREKAILGSALPGTQSCDNDTFLQYLEEEQQLWSKLSPQ